MQSALAVSQAKYWHLRQVDLFSGLATSEVRHLGELVETDLREQGEAIYREGDLSDTIYVLKSGKIKLSRISEDGKELTLCYVRPGEVFGELAITGQELRNGTATVVEDAFICSIGRDHLEGYLGRNPRLALEFSRIIGRRKQQIESRIIDLVSKDVRTRLAHALSELAADFGYDDDRGTLIDLPLTQSDLAQLVGSTRETTSTIFNEFRRDGLVDSEGRSIWVLDPEALIDYSWDQRADKAA
jgi:CRP/FNR family transcriptional regulator